jgi:hypothetical protein
MVISLDDSFRAYSKFPEQRFQFLWESRNLPPPAHHFGKSGLLALQEAEQRRTGLPFTFVIPTTITNEGELIVAIQRLIQQMQINVKFASPVAFIPLPTQCETQARLIARYGMIDVFYFDSYSIALNKIERGNSRDIADVKLLVQRGINTLSELDVAYQEVLSQLGRGRYPRITPQRFSERYTSIRKLL